LERPINANSGRGACGQDAKSTALESKVAEEIFIRKQAVGRIRLGRVWGGVSELAILKAGWMFGGQIKSRLEACGPGLKQAAPVLLKFNREADFFCT